MDTITRTAVTGTAVTGTAVTGTAAAFEATHNNRRRVKSSHGLAGDTVLFSLRVPLRG